MWGHLVHVNVIEQKTGGPFGEEITKPSLAKNVMLTILSQSFSSYVCHRSVRIGNSNQGRLNLGKANDVSVIDC